MFWLNVHSAHDEFATPEDAFAADPFHGNIIDNIRIYGNTICGDNAPPMGISFKGDPRYYLTFDLSQNNSQFLLPPGDYIITVYEKNAGNGVWCWAESTINFGRSDILRVDTMDPGEWMDVSDVTGSTGTVALDIYGRYLYQQ